MTKTVKLLIIIASAAIILGLILGTIGLLIFGIDREPLEEFNKSYDTAITGIYIDVDIADVRIYKTESDKIEVIYYDNEKNYFTIEERDGELYIKRDSNRHWFGNLSWFGTGVKYELEVGIPANFNGELSVKSDVGNIKVTALTLTDCKLSSSTGDINGESIVCSGRFSVSLSTGSISVTAVEAKTLNAKSNTGDINIKYMTVSESIHLETNTGDVYGSVTDSIENYTVSSDTDVGDNDLPGHLSGGNKTLEVYTDTGDIEFDFNK
ncbi:hypothetical protein EOM82_01650 [bacterium]|nr:hypothetical protein [bacterium]